MGRTRAVEDEGLGAGGSGGGPRESAREAGGGA